MENQDIVNEEFLSPVVQNCPFCNSSQLTNEITLQSSPEVTMFTCSNCNGSSANRIPSSTYLAKLYDKETYTPDMFKADRPTVRCAKRIYSKIDLSGRDSVRILDYGGSSGNLTFYLAELIKANHKISIEADVVDFEDQIKFDGINFVGINEFDQLEKKYDIIILSAVLEHIPNYLEVLRNIIKKLNKYSYVYIRTPFELPLSKLVNSYKIRWPRHIHDMGPEFLENILALENVNSKLIWSSPSVIEADFGRKPIVFLIAFTLKLLGYIEALFIKPLLGYKKYKWRYVGGWEVVHQITNNEENH